MTQLPTRNALRFDGSTEYIDFGNPKAFSFTNQLTLEAWIRPEIHDNKNCLFSKGIDGLSLLFEWDLLLLDSDTTKRMHSKTKLESGKWQHVAVSYNGTLEKDNLKIYINGTLDSSFDENNLILSNQENLIIGKDKDNVFNLYRGELAYFVIWNIERQPWQILQDKNLHIVAGEPNLVLLLSMQDTSKKNLQDSSGNQNHGDLFRIGKDGPQSIQQSDFVAYDYQLKSPLPSILKETIPSTKKYLPDDSQKKNLPVSQLTKRSGEIAKLISRINQHNDRLVAQKRQQLDSELLQNRTEANQKKHKAHQKASELVRLSNIDSIFFSKKGSLVAANPRTTPFNPMKDANLIAHYPLHEDARDKSGNGLHGVATDQVKFVEDEAGACAEFTREGANIQLPAFQETYNYFSVSCWFKLNPYQGIENWDPRTGYLGKNIVAGISLIPYKNSPLGLSVRFYFLDRGSAITPSMGTCGQIQKDKTNWHHVALTVGVSCNKAVYKVYLDGKDTKSRDEYKLSFDSPHTNSYYLRNALSIGGAYKKQFDNQIYRTSENYSWSLRTYKENCELLDGYIKNVFFFKRDLSEDEVKSLYELESDDIKGSCTIHKYNFDNLFINDFAADLGTQRLLMAGSESSRGIYSFNTNSKNLKLEVETTYSPSTLCFDDINSVIYWIEGKREIWRAKTEDYKKEKILDLDQTSLDFPNQIEVDAKSSTLFWSSPSGIWSSDLDGNHKKCLIYKLEAPSPVAMTIDTKNKRLFWIDSRLKKIRQSDYSGKHIVDLYSVENPLGGMDYSPDPSNNPDQREDYLYWNEKIVELNKNGIVRISSKLCYGKSDGSSQEIESTAVSGDSRLIINTKSQESILQVAKAYADLKNETLAASKKIDDAHLTAQNNVELKTNDLLKTQEDLDEKTNQKNTEHSQTKSDNQQALNQAAITAQKKTLDAKTKASQNLSAAHAKAAQITNDAQTQAKSIKGKARDNYNNAKKERGKY